MLSFRKRPAISLTLAALLVCSAQVPASAQVDTVTVKIGDLDLKSSKDLNILDDRVRSAAIAVCRNRVNTASRIPDEAACLTGVWNEVLNAVSPAQRQSLLASGITEGRRRKAPLQVVATDAVSAASTTPR